jgi:MinD superfamily P-loop ATPase
MSGYGYGQEQPTQECPYCGKVCEADYVSVGVGMVQCGPYFCQSCHASEIGAFDEYRDLTEQEKKTGWYKPDSDPGSSANVIDGNIVSHRAMKETYQREFRNNPMWSDANYVSDWWEKTRKAKD